MAGYIGSVPVPESTQVRQTYTAVAGQTTFPTPGYTPNFIDVYLNGIKMVNGEDFEAVNGSDVVLSEPASADDILDFITYKTFNVQSGSVDGTWGADAHLNPQTINDLTITSGHNGMLTGPVDITGTLTVESGANLVILDELTYLEDNNTWTGNNHFSGNISWNNPPAGTVLQVVSDSLTGSYSTSQDSWFETGLSISIIPKSTSSKLMIFLSGGSALLSVGHVMYTTFFRDDTNLGDTIAGLTRHGYSDGNSITPHSIIYYDSPGTSSAIVYKTKFRSSDSAEQVFFNYDVGTVTMVVMEIAG